MEQYCLNGFTATYNTPSKDPGGFTYGGYSKSIVVDRHFVLTVPDSLDPAGAAPLLCAGITTYSPLKHWNVKPGMTVGLGYRYFRGPQVTVESYGTVAGGPVNEATSTVDSENHSVILDLKVNL